MSWGDIDLSTARADNEVLPESEATNFLITGAGKNKFDSEKVDVYAKVLDGPEKGARTVFSYPNPNDYDWVIGVFKRLVNSIGIKIEEGESPVDYLIRVAKLEGKFTAPVKHREYEKDGLTTVKGEVNTWKIKSYKG